MQPQPVAWNYFGLYDRNDTRMEEEEEDPHTHEESSSLFAGLLLVTSLLVMMTHVVFYTLYFSLWGQALHTYHMEQEPLDLPLVRTVTYILWGLEAWTFLSTTVFSVLVGEEVIRQVYQVSASNHLLAAASLTYLASLVTGMCNLCFYLLHQFLLKSFLEHYTHCHPHNDIATPTISLFEALSPRVATF